MTPALVVAGVEVGAQGRGGVGQLVGGWPALRSGSIAVPVRCSCASRARAAAAPAERPSTPATACRDAAHRGRAVGSARRPVGLEHHGDPVRRSSRSRSARESLTAFDWLPGHVEAAAGQVVGLVRGERQRDEEDGDPSREDPAAMTSEEPRQLDHRLAHWLASQSLAPGGACL